MFPIWIIKVVYLDFCSIRDAVALKSPVATVKHKYIYKGQCY